MTKNVVFPQIGDSFAKKEFGVTSVLFPKLLLGTSVGAGPEKHQSEAFDTIKVFFH